MVVIVSGCAVGGEGLARLTHRVGSPDFKQTLTQERTFVAVERRPISPSPPQPHLFLSFFFTLFPSPPLILKSRSLSHSYLQSTHGLPPPSRHPWSPGVRVDGRLLYARHRFDRGQDHDEFDAGQGHATRGQGLSQVSSPCHLVYLGAVQQG